jgi:hypothetical protein
MDQKPLWKMESGEFAGWRQGDQLYDAKGKHVGRFQGDVAYSIKGDYIGEIVDDEWLAQHAHRPKPSISARAVGGSIHIKPRARRSGRPSKIWKDPEI